MLESKDLPSQDVIYDSSFVGVETGEQTEVESEKKKRLWRTRCVSRNKQQAKTLRDVEVNPNRAKSSSRLPQGT